MSDVTLPLVDIAKNEDGTVALSLNMKGLKLLASLMIEEEVPRFDLRLHRGANFEFNWPKETELHTKVREGSIETPFGTRAVRIGRLQRHTAGQMRDVVNVFIDYRPIVQFLASDDGRKMASVIRQPNSKRHVFDAAELPTAYQNATNMAIESYRQYVEGDKSTTGLAVICDPDDYETMVRHALMRLGVDTRQRQSSIERIRQKPRNRSRPTKAP
jgi:hypothetical protein